MAAMLATTVQHQKGIWGETARIADQLRRVYDGSAWHGPSLKQILSGLTDEQARARLNTNVHSIWEIVQHTGAWARIGRERLSATDIRDHNEEENWGPMVGTWHQAQTSLDQEMRLLEQAILSFPESRLEEAAPATEPQTFYVLLHGVVQHIAYHSGQIMLLKKASQSAT